MGDLVDYVVLYRNYVPYDLRPHYVVLLCHLSVYEMQNIKIKWTRIRRYQRDCQRTALTF